LAILFGALHVGARFFGHSQVLNVNSIQLLLNHKQSSTQSMNARLCLLTVMMALLGGCASEPPLTPSPDQAGQPYYDRNAAYNRPYKIKGKTYYPLASALGYREKGTASWYGAESGNRTASGARFNPQALSAAHKTLPIPSTVRVTNLRNGRSVEVLINDRGPFYRNRLIDLSQGAAQQLGIQGLADVEVECLASQSNND
jgi:rare lipoprotein A